MWTQTSEVLNQGQGQVQVPVPVYHGTVAPSRRSASRSPAPSANGSGSKWARRTCDVCGLTFARSDTLKRHQAVHQGDSRPRRSRAKACSRCSKSKLRCDGGRPCCNRCTEKRLSCSYAAERTDNDRLEGIKDYPTTQGSSDPPVTFAQSAIQIGDAPHVTPLNFSTSLPTSTALIPAPQATLPGFPLTTIPDFNPFDPQFQGPGLSGSSLPFFFGPLLAHTNETTAPMDPFIGSYHIEDVSPNIQDVNTIDSTDLGIESANMFWSEWESLTTNQDPGFTSPSFFAALTQMEADSNRPVPESQRIVDTAHTGERSTSRDEPSREASISRAPSPAFFETDPMGKSMFAWHTFYDARGDNGDILRGHRQILLPADGEIDITVERLKSRWPVLDRFTFDHRSKNKIVEAVIFSGIPHKEQQAVYRTLTRLKDTVYLHFFSLYLQYVHFRVPLLHLPTLDPGVDNGLLSLAILSVGAFYSDMSSARQFAIIMLEIVRRGCEHVMIAQPRMSRDLQVVQALLLSGMSRCGGQGREEEIYERYRFVSCTILRRMMGFQPLTMPAPPTEANGSEVACWRAWRRYEQLKRTALVCFALEADAAVMAQLGSTIRVSELELTLPCTEELWEAKTAQDWLRIYRPPTPAACIPIRRILNEIGRTIDPRQDPALREPFSALIICKTLLASSQGLMELEYCAPLAFSATLIELNAAQSRLAMGSNETQPWFGEATIDSDGQSFTPALITYHASALLRYFRPYQMGAIVGRGAPEWHVAARESVSTWMRSHPVDARRLALHAGQIIRIIRHVPYQGPEEGLAGFFAVVYLYMLIKTSPFSTWPGTSAPVIVLDVPQTKSPVPWFNLGYPPSLDGLGSLTSPGIALKLLTIYGQIMSRRVWSNDRFLGRMLLNMADKERSVDADWAIG